MYISCSEPCFLKVSIFLSHRRLCLANLTRRHVFRDLRPYVCTFQSCDAKLFGSMHEWFEHEMLEHRSIRLCCMCDYRCGSTQIMTVHLQDTHNFSKTQVPIVMSSCKIISQAAGRFSCPFCDKEPSTLQDQASLKSIRRHIARHFEQMALFALPRGRLEEGESNQDHSEAEDTTTVHSGEDHENSVQAADPWGSDQEPTSGSVHAVD